MKKLAAGVAGAGTLAAVIALGTSYYMGGKIQHAFEKTAVDWSAQEGFSVTVLEYERGIWGSKAKTLWSLQSEEESLDITAQHDITHGPWAKGQAGHIDTQFDLTDDSDPDLRKALQGRAVLEWQTQIAWQGETEHTLSSPELTVNFMDGSDLVWGGLQGELSLSAERNAAQGWAKMPNIQLKSEDGSRLEVQASAMDFSGAIVPGHSFWDGPANLTMGSLKIFEPEGESTVSMQGLTLGNATTLREDMVDTSFKLSVAHLNAPGYRTSEMVMNLSLKNIDASWMDQVMAWANGKMQDEAHQMELLRSLPVLLGRKPEIAIERLAVQTPEGLSELSALLAYRGDNPSRFNPTTDLYGSLKASMPQALLALLLGEKVRSEYLDLLEQMGQEITEEQLLAAVQDGVDKRMRTLLSNGIVKVQGESLHTELEYSQGDIKLNGHDTPVDQLMGIGGAL